MSSTVVEDSFIFLYIQRNSIYRYSFCVPAHDNSTNYVTYINNQDSLVVDYIRRSSNNNHCFSRHGIDWFPPYLVRINKIDYSKFNVPEVKYKYLKDPMHRNAPRYDKKWEDEQKKKAEKEERRKERKAG